MTNVFFYLLLLFILAFFIAKLEGNIEGPHPWYKELPTKRYRNRLTDLLFDTKPITGYHIWLFSTVFLIFHYLFLFGLSWSLKNEFIVLGAFVFFMVLEDFLSIILNPYFGPRKFSRRYITWHIHWIGPMPLSYIQGLVMASLLFIGAGLFFF